MNEYTLQAWSDSPIGRVNKIDVTVTASSETEAREKARKVVHRDSYSVVAIKVLSEPQVSVDARPRIKKG